MALIGLSNLKWAELTEGANGSATYGTVNSFGKAISSSTDITNNEAELYADNVLAESDYTFSKGSITLGIADDDTSVFAGVLGHEVDESTGEMVRTASDTAPYVGLGRIITKMVNGVYKYKVEFLSKVKFKEPSQENNTKGETVEFSTPEIEGTIFALGDANGTWSKANTFDTIAEAQTYLNACFTGTTETYTVIYNSNGGTGTITSVEVTAGSSITLDTGASLTRSSYTFEGWATTPTATTPNVTSPYTPTGDVTLYAVWDSE